MKSKMFVVAKREFMENVTSKAFLISLVLTPAIMILFGILPSLLSGSGDKTTIVIGVIDESRWVSEQLSKQLTDKNKLPSNEPRYLLRTISSSEGKTNMQIADSLILNEEVEGVLVFPNNVENDSFVVYRSIRVANFRVMNQLEKTIDELLKEHRLRAANISTDVMQSLIKPFDLSPVKVSKEGEEKKIDFKTQFFSSYIFVMLMFMLIISSGQMLVRSILEEKSNRIIEVLLSSCSAGDLMKGKILGLSGLGFAQISLWMLLGVAAVPSMAVMMLSGNGVWLLLLYFTFGYLFYSAIFVGVGSVVTTEQEAQQVNSYLILFILFPVVLNLSAMENSNSTMMQVFSFIPLFTPTMMTLRISVQVPSTIEILGTLSMLLVSTIFAMWASGKIFRIAILSTGKRLTMKEIFLALRSQT